jgi:hypothetical protein
MNRRDFLRKTAGTAAAVATGGMGALAAETQPPRGFEAVLTGCPPDIDPRFWELVEECRKAIKGRTGMSELLLDTAPGRQ